jgi:hypothetical protein
MVIDILAKRLNMASSRRYCMIRETLQFFGWNAILSGKILHILRLVSSHVRRLIYIIAEGKQAFSCSKSSSTLLAFLFSLLNSLLMGFS